MKFVEFVSGVQGIRVLGVRASQSSSSVHGFSTVGVEGI